MEFHQTEIRYLLSFLGLAGVDHHENMRIQKIWSFFEWCMLPIVIWLPVQWYAHLQHRSFTTIDWIFVWIIWLAFLLETSIVAALVKRKLYYLLTNWVNLIAIVVCFPWIWKKLINFADFKACVLFVSAAVIVPWLMVAFNFLRKNRFSATLLILVVSTTLFGVLMTFFEPNIHSPFEGIWLAWTTITTVGYGDIVPMTFIGRFIAIIGIVLGLILIALVTANFSVFLIEKEEKKQRKAVREVDEDVKIILDRLDEIENQIKQLKKT